MKKIVIALIVVAVLVGGFYAFNSYIYHEKQGTTDASFTQRGEYVCAEGKSLSAAFREGVARLTLSDKRVFTLEETFSDDESGVKFSNEGDEIVFWVKDDSAFLEEGGVTSYEACRII